MTPQAHTIDVSQSPELLAFARRVKREGAAFVLKAEGEELARVSPPSRRRHSLKGKPTFDGDPFWRIIGMGSSGVPSDASERVDELLAEFELMNQA
jgi:hypothetical protein